MSMQYGIKEVLNLQTYDFSTNNPLAFIDYAETTEIDNSGTRIDVTGGQGNYKLLCFDHSKTSSLKLSLPLADLTLLSLMMGDAVSTGAQNVMQREVWTVSGASSITLSNPPVAGTTPTVYYLKDQRDNGTALTKVASAPTAGQYSITGSTITVNSADNGKQLVVWYQYATPSTTTKFSMKANKFVQPLKLVGNGIIRDQVTGTDRASVITIYNARIQPNFNLVMSSTSATKLDLTLDMYAVQQGSDLVYYDCVFLT
jgi:hypothetical protein